MLKQHAKKIAGFSALGAVLPFLVGADSDVVDLAAGTDSASFWLVVAKLLAASLGPAATMAVGLLAAALGAALVAAGRAKLADKDPSNDGFGVMLVAAGRRLSPSADADSVVTPALPQPAVDLARPFSPASSPTTSPAIPSSLPSPSQPPSQPPSSKNGP